MSSGCLASVWHVKLNRDCHNSTRKQKSARHQFITKALALANAPRLYLGLDFGTSGARAICIDGMFISVCVLLA